VVAIGECGLDRNIDLPLDIQTSIFKRHIELAETLQKPLVIHCVRAFSELIALKKNTKSTVPWIIHGFHKKEEVFQQLLKHDFYFSFGAAMRSRQYQMAGFSWKQTIAMILASSKFTIAPPRYAMSHSNHYKLN
jgi:Tat protein secretion system quality control protein TatD with DNase activity